MAGKRITASTSESSKSGPGRSAGSFRDETACRSVSLRDNRGDRPAVIGARNHIGLIGRIEMIGMHEIGVPAVVAERQDCRAADARAAAQAYSSPYAESSALRRAARSFHHIALDPAEARRGDIFLALRRHQLHADADAEKRTALARTASFSASTMPLSASRPLRQSANAPTPGSTMRSARNTIRDRASRQSFAAASLRAPHARTPWPPNADCRSRNR
jgi:hypothetical protein